MKATGIFLFISVAFLIFSCNSKQGGEDQMKVRGLADTVGFAHLDWQMDSVVARIIRQNSSALAIKAQPDSVAWKVAVCPHDDYLYAGWLYEAVLKNIKARTIIIFGVAHKAKDFNLEGRLVFDSFDAWSGPYGKVRVSGLREQIQQYLPDNYYSVHDSMQMVEHSVEALIPFLQNHRRDVEIVSILVPYMDMGRITDIAKVLSNAIFKVLNANKLRWGDDVALLVTSDAVHYGDEEWGGKDYAPFGTDSLGTARALTLENEIFRNCFGDTLKHENAERFYAYTVNPANFREYKWTWCGRYSVPMGLETSVFLQELLHLNPLVGMPLGYSTSILNAHLPVVDLRMGKTAVATQHHWVGYPEAGFK